jgi:uridine kinase
VTGGADDETPKARVVVLAGPSGCGKTRLAERAGVPIVALDDFYRDGDDPGMPMVGGHIDWEDPASWDADAAIAALGELCRTGRAEIPIYSIADDARVGSRPVELDGSPVVVAEGIFAAEVVSRLDAEGLLADALLLRSPALVTFWRRLLRDHREGRKAPLVLVRQGLAKLRDERRVVARQALLGCRRIAKPAAATVLADLAGATSGGRPQTGTSTAAA